METWASLSEIATHELGHQWGLGEEYLDDCRCNGPHPNCLDPALSGDDPFGAFDSTYCGPAGTNCPSPAQITCMGNQNPSGGRCAMSFGGSPPPRGYCNHCYNHLLTIPQLQC